MAALVLRTVLYGDTVYWSLLWRRARAEWLPFLAPVTVLVFSRPVSTRARERRPGAGRIVSSLVLVALIVLAFGLGTGYDFTTTGLIPTAVVTCALAIGLLRAAYDSFALELLKASPACADASSSSATARASRGCSASSARSRGGIGYEFLGVGRPSASVAGPAAARRARSPTCPAILERVRPDELILAEADFDERTGARDRRARAPAGRQVRLAPNTTELLVQQGRVRARPGRAAVRAAAADPRRAGTGRVKRAFDLVVSALVARRRAAALAPRSRSRSSSTRAGPVFYVDRRVGVGEREFGMLKFRTMVADARRAAGASSSRRTRPRGRCSRSATTRA